MRADGHTDRWATMKKLINNFDHHSTTREIERNVLHVTLRAVG